MLERSYIQGYGSLNTVHSKSDVVVSDDVLNKVGRKTRKTVFETEMPDITLDLIFDVTEECDELLSFIELRDRIFDDTSNMSKAMAEMCSSEKISITKGVLEWLGYDSEKDYDNKASFIKLLNAYQIEFKQIKHNDPTIHNYPDLVDEAAQLPTNALNRKKWIIMSSRDFKKMVLCLRTSRAEQIREYYLAVEDLFKMYCEYTLHFQLRREKRRLGKKQGTIDDLVRGMEEMKLERKEAERKHEEAERKHELERQEAERKHELERQDAQQRYNNLMARGDQLLHHAEQAEEDRILIMDDIHQVRKVAAPNPDEPKNVHRMAVVKMSPQYEWAEGDPKYYSEVDALAVRTQIKSFNGRLRKIKNAGSGTNKDASVLTSFDSPNPISLYS